MWLFDTFKDLSVQEIGKHLDNYVQLYIKPAKVWKKIVSYRNDSYNLLVQYIIYLVILFFTIFKERSLVIPALLLEILLTIIPFSFFILPFKVFTKLFNKKIRANRLFRLFLVFKLQLIPPLILLNLIIEFFQIESPYLIGVLA